MFPTLRPLQISRFRDENGEFFLFHDREELAQDVAIPVEMAPVLVLLDGQHSPAQILEKIARSGELSSATLERFLGELEELNLLQSPRIEELRAQKIAEFAGRRVRESAIAGLSYPDDPASLRELLQEKWREGETRLPPRAFEPGKVRGIVTPHIDFGRGGHTEAASYAPLLENVRATGKPFDTLVVLGIAHAGVRFPFCGLKQDFATPLGVQKCDRAFVEDLETRVGARFLAEPLAHKDEHSIEFSSVFCQFFDELQNAQLVPILCGGFWESLRLEQAPEEVEDGVADFVAALQEVTSIHEAAGKKIGFIASVDGAHVGSQFGDDSTLTRERLREIEWSDRAWCAAIEAGDKTAFHAHFARDGNRFNVDAHPALYTLLAAFPQWRGQLLDYDQAFSRAHNIVVSFASLALFEV